jgi:mercuric ion transport protein
MNAQLEKRLTPDAASGPGEFAHARLARSGGSGLVAAGSVFGALAASACCIAPLALFSLGVSGAWIGNLTSLAPYQPIFVIATLGFLGAGFVMVYRKPKAACAIDGTCAYPISTRTTKIALWGATILIAAAIAFPYVTPLILDI